MKRTSSIPRCIRLDLKGFDAEIINFSIKSYDLLLSDSIISCVLKYELTTLASGRSNRIHLLPNIKITGPLKDLSQMSEGLYTGKHL